MKIADFFADIGFRVDTKSLQQFNSSMSSVVNTVRGLAFALTGAMTAWQMLQTKIGQNAQTMLNFKTYTGENIEEVRKLAAVMQGTNLNFSMDTFLNDISNVKTQLRELQIFGEGSNMAQALRVVGLPGLNPGALTTIQDFLKLLKQIPDAATRAMLVDRLGVSRQFLNILDLTDQQYRELEKRADKIFPNEQELKRRQQASLEIYMTWLELKNLFESKVTDFAPILEELLHRISDIVSDSEKLKMILEGIKWTFILFAISSIASALGTIVANLRMILPLAGIVGGIKLGQRYNEEHGIDNLSGKGLRNQAIGATAGGAAGTAATAGIVLLMRRLLGSQAKKAVGKAAAGAVARQAAAGPGNANPYLAAGLAIWGLVDIAKAIYDVVKTSGNQTITIDPQTGQPSTENNQFNWNANLNNLTINAQNVYLYSNKTSLIDQPIQRSDTYNEDYNMLQNNVARTRYSVTGGW